MNTATVAPEDLRLQRADCLADTRAIHVGISGRHRDPVHIVTPTSNGVLVRFLDGTLRHVHPADLARDAGPTESITRHSHTEIGNGIVDVETHDCPATLTEPALMVHGVYVDFSAVLELDQARELRDAMVLAVRELEALHAR